MIGPDDCPFDTEKFERNQEPIVFDNIINEPMKTANDIEADAYYAKGFDKTPIFNVDHDDFYNNGTQNRQRLSFKEGTGAQKYSASSRNSPFFIRYSDTQGKQFIRKIK